MKIRLFINEKLATGESVNLRKDHVHYLGNVLRSREGKGLYVFNPDDGEYKAVFRDGNKVEIGEQTKAPQKKPKLALIFAPVKFGKIDFLVQKATELGVTSIHPVKTRYTAITRINYDRMSANAIEAVEQTGRISFPEISEMEDLEKLIDGWSSSQKIIFCDESKTGKPFKKALEALPKTAKDFAILIGPEGGFSPEEQEFLRSKKFIYSASMGERLLRAETAAIAALGAFQAIKGDWS